MLVLPEHSQGRAPEPGHPTEVGAFEVHFREDKGAPALRAVIAHLVLHLPRVGFLPCDGELAGTRGEQRCEQVHDSNSRCLSGSWCVKANTSG